MARTSHPAADWVSRWFGGPKDPSQVAVPPPTNVIPGGDYVSTCDHTKPIPWWPAWSGVVPRTHGLGRAASGVGFPPHQVGSRTLEAAPSVRHSMTGHTVVYLRREQVVSAAVTHRRATVTAATHPRWLARLTRPHPGWCRRFQQPASLTPATTPGCNQRLRRVRTLGRAKRRLLTPVARRAAATRGLAAPLGSR